jgi:hypothetical protein
MICSHLSAASWPYIFPDDTLDVPDVRAQYRCTLRLYIVDICWDTGCIYGLCVCKQSLGRTHRRNTWIETCRGSIGALPSSCRELLPWWPSRGLHAPQSTAQGRQDKARALTHDVHPSFAALPINVCSRPHMHLDVYASTFILWPCMCSDVHAG